MKRPGLIELDDLHLAGVTTVRTDSYRDAARGSCDLIDGGQQSRVRGAFLKEGITTTLRMTT